MASALSHIVYTQYDLVQKPSTLDSLIGYFTPSHVIHQRLLLQFVSHIVYTQYDLVQKPSTLDALIGYFTLFYVIHQKLLLQFVSAPEDGSKKRPKHVEHYCSY